jgi:type VI secretion system secreted protein Hcp
MPTAVESMFLKLDGIKGEATYKDESGWIAVESFSWGLSQMGSAGGGSGAGKASFQDFHFTKTTDTSSPQLFLRCATGEHLHKDGGAGVADLRFVKINREAEVKGGVEYLKIKLTEVLVSSFSESSGGDVPQDAFSLNFGKIEFQVMNESATFDVRPT